MTRRIGLSSVPKETKSDGMLLLEASSRWLRSAFSIADLQGHLKSPEDELLQLKDDVIRIM